MVIEVVPSVKLFVPKPVKPPPRASISGITTPDVLPGRLVVPASVVRLIVPPVMEALPDSPITSAPRAPMLKPKFAPFAEVRPVSVGAPPMMFSVLSTVLLVLNPKLDPFTRVTDAPFAATAVLPMLTVFIATPPARTVPGTVTMLCVEPGAPTVLMVKVPVAVGETAVFPKVA